MLDRKKDSRLIKIVSVLLLICVVSFGVFHYGPALTARFSSARTEDLVDEMAEARQLLAQGKADEAAQRLTALVEGPVDPLVTPQALMLLGDIESDRGQAQAARACYERVFKEFPGSPDHGRASVAYARLLEEAGEVDSAAGIYEEVKQTSPRNTRAAALTGLGRKAEQEGDLLAARNSYRDAVADAPWDSPSWQEAVDLLGRVQVELIFAPQETPESKHYTVEKGDSLTSIGNGLNTTQGLLMRANGLTPQSTLSIGQQLKYTPKDFRIVIERSTCRLFLFDQDGIFKVYKVGLGKPGHETTLGTYKIGNKQKDPIWHKPGHGPVPAGDPQNELGTRWMPLVPDEKGLPKDLGIHGTIAPETIGTFASKGCARMHKQDVEELYDLVVRSTPVEIVKVYHPEGVEASAPAETTTDSAQEPPVQAQ